MIALAVALVALAAPGRDDALTPDERAEVELLRAIAPGPPHDAVPADLSALDTSGLDLAVRRDDDVARWVTRFTAEPGIAEPFAVWLGRLDHHRSTLELILTGEGLPRTFAVVALVESGVLPNATSTIGAAGVWQIMEPTAALLELRVDAHVDERRDLHRSTAAAALLLRELVDRFGDPDLALLAYNAGPETVAGAIAAAESRRVDAVLAQLGSEPRHFLAKIHAAALVDANRDRLGVRAIPYAPEALSPVPVGPHALEALARCADTSPAALQRWNPPLGPAGAPPEGYPVRVPDPARFAACLSETP